MKIFSVLAFVSAVVAVTVRRNVTPPPACAFSCLTHTNTHGCSMTDNSCLCHNAAFIADQLTCVAQACTNPADLQQAETFAQQNCLTVGVTLVASGTPAATGSASVPSPTSPSASSSSPSTMSNEASTLRGSAHALLLASIAAFTLAL